MEGYLLCCDILGFSKIIENLEEKGILERIEEWIEIIEKLAKTYDISNYSLLSDTLFVSVDDTTESLNKLVDFSRTLLNTCVSHSLPIRGAISFGTYNWGKLVYGKAVISAHKLEIEQNWIGITCDNNITNVEQLWNFNKLICYSAPKKKSAIQLHPVIDWDIPKIEDLTSLISKRGLTKNGETMNWEWLEKINNTIIFKLYKEYIKNNNLSPERYHGLTSLEFMCVQAYQAER